MASGHVNRTNRPNTWLHRPATQREESPCQLGAVHTCAGFSDAGVQVYPRVCAPGVREAPRHEVAGGDRRWCGVRYGD